VDSGGDLLSIYDYFVSGYERDRQDLLASEQRLRGRERSHRACSPNPGVSGACTARWRAG
jgi:hypothetical protein